MSHCSRHHGVTTLPGPRTVTVTDDTDRVTHAVIIIPPVNDAAATLRLTVTALPRSLGPASARRTVLGPADSGCLSQESASTVQIVQWPSKLQRQAATGRRRRRRQPACACATAYRGASRLLRLASGASRVHCCHCHCHTDMPLNARGLPAAAQRSVTVPRRPCQSLPEMHSPPVAA